MEEKKELAGSGGREKIMDLDPDQSRSGVGGGRRRAL